MLGGLGGTIAPRGPWRLLGQREGPAPGAQAGFCSPHHGIVLFGQDLASPAASRALTGCGGVLIDIKRANCSFLADSGGDGVRHQFQGRQTGWGTLRFFRGLWCPEPGEDRKEAGGPRN